MITNSQRWRARNAPLSPTHQHAMDVLSDEWQTSQVCRRLAGCSHHVFDDLVRDGLIDSISVPTCKWGEVFNTVYYRLPT